MIDLTLPDFLNRKLNPGSSTMKERREWLKSLPPARPDGQLSELQAAIAEGERKDRLALKQIEREEEQERKRKQAERFALLAALPKKPRRKLRRVK